MHKANKKQTNSQHETTVNRITKPSQQLLLECSYLKRMIVHVGLLSILLNTVSGSELLKRDFLQLKDTLGNLSVQASQALPQHKTGVWNASLTLLSLHQHVWHIEWISMTTLTFSQSTENCFKRMESTDPSCELRCYAKMYYMAFKSFLWNVWVSPKPSERGQRDVWNWERIWHHASTKYT